MAVRLPTYPTKKSGASFSPCRIWRYVLWRTWGDLHGSRCAFIGLNPSTADEEVNDPTVTRCMGFAERWGFHGMYMLNLFSFRATDPKEMKLAEQPVGPADDVTLRHYAGLADRVVCCWGNHGAHRKRSDAVRKLLSSLDREVCCFKINGTGEPVHPLYLPNAQLLIPYSLAWRS
jgi:hypothetical protein